MFSKNEIPGFLVCPVSQQIFLEPVTLVPSGQTFEKEIIELIIKKQSQPLCPLTRLPIESFVKAWTVSLAVEGYLQSNPQASDEQYRRVTLDSNVDLLIKSTKSNITTTSRATVNSHSVQPNIADDERFARELQREENERSRKEHKEMRPFGISQEKKQISVIKLDAYKTLKFNDQKKCEELLADIQDLIYALHFETGPKPRGSIDNFSLLFFAVIEQALLQALPWQKIKVQDGPKYLAMYQVLKAAIDAIKALDPTHLINEIERQEGEYDCVKTLFGGEQSMSRSSYANFAKSIGTVSGQPGALVSQILVRVEKLFQELPEEYFVSSSQNTQHSSK